MKKSTKPFKPLASKKFYLDLKNNTSLLKLETKLKSLGAVSNEYLDFTLDNTFLFTPSGYIVISSSNIYVGVYNSRSTPLLLLTWL